MKRRRGLILFLVACLPWLTLSLLAYFDLARYGALAGLAIVLALFFPMPKGNRWGVMQAFSLLYFLVASAAVFVFGDDLATRIPNLLAGGFACLAIMAGYGALEGVFFPAHYLGIDYPESMSESPVLRRTFWSLTLLWDVIFLLGLAVNIVCMLALRGDASISVASLSSASLFGAGMAATPIVVLLISRRMEVKLVEKGPLAIDWRPPVLSPGRSLRKNEYDAVVVGSGLGGLACASLLSQAGMKVLLVERARLVGGYCQTYNWEGYPLNAGPTLMLGSDEGGVLNALIKRLGLEGEIPLRRLEWGIANGKIALRLGQGADADMEKLGGKFPKSREELAGLLADLRRFRGELMDRLDSLSSALPSDLEEYREQFLRHPLSSRWQSISYQAMLEDYLSDEALVSLLGRLAALLGGDARDYPAYEGARLLVALFLDGLSYPVRHFSHLAGKLAGAVTEAGGEILTSCGAEEVLIQGEGAEATPIGLRLSDGSQVRSNVVVLDIDPRRVAKGLVAPSALGTYFIREMDRLKPSCSAFLLHLVFQEDLRMPERVFLLPAKARRIRTGDTYLEVDSIVLNKEMRNAPGGAGCVLLARVNVPSDCYPAFEDDSRGAELGAELTALIKDEIAAVMPAVKKAVREFVTLPTHFTRLTSTSRGSAYGFAPLIDQWYFRRPGPRLPLPNTYLVGGWSRYGGGLEGAILSGVIVARELCGEHPYPDHAGTAAFPEMDAASGGKEKRRGRTGKPSRKERKKKEERERAEEEEEHGGEG